MPAPIPPRKPPPPKKGKPRPATEADEQTFRARARGALIGLAVGEALGVSNEGKSLPAEMFPALNEWPLDGLRGGGPRELKRGQTSWATQQAVCLANGLRVERRFDVVAAGKAYAKWLSHSPPVTETVREALTLIVDGRSPEFSGRRVFAESGKRPAGNEALARALPLAVFYAKHKDDRRRSSLEDSAITNFHPLCRTAVATFTGVVAASLSTPKDRLAPEEIAKLYETELGAAAATVGTMDPDFVQLAMDASEDLRADFKLARANDPELYGPDLSMFLHAANTRVALRLALWELFHAPNFRAGVLDAVNRGGDAAANGAVVGALLGATYGESAIPEEWREGVLEAVGPSGGVWWNVYHPRYLLNLVGVEPGSAPVGDSG